MLNVKKKLRQNRDSVIKVTRKEIVNRATNKYIYSKITIRVLNKNQN